MSESHHILPWATLETQLLADYRVFRVRTNRRQHPKSGRIFDLFAIECPDWVNVVATTPANELILVGQFRHGTNTVEWEIPGGIIDPEDPDPLSAGLRELREEAGYVGTRARLLGDIFPNPAIQNNRCHAIRVEECVLTGSQTLDAAEDIVVRLVPWREIPDMIRSKTIRHSLAVVALTQALLESGDL